MPVAPNLAELLPDSIVVTPEDVQIYKEACDAWESNEYSKEEIISQYGLSRSSACDWAIFGYTVQGEITIESIENQQADYAEKLRHHINFLIETINNLYEVSSRSNPNPE
jgi:hypothetical protein